MRVLSEIFTDKGSFTLVEGRFKVLHEIPLRNTLLRTFDGHEHLHNVAVIFKDGKKEEIIGEVDLILYQSIKLTFLHLFEFKTRLSTKVAKQVVKQVRRASIIAEMVRVWLNSLGMEVKKWSYTVLVRGEVESAVLRYLIERSIGVITWDELTEEGKKILRKIPKREFSELRG